MGGRSQVSGVRGQGSGVRGQDLPYTSLLNPHSSILRSQGSVVRSQVVGNGRWGMDFLLLALALIFTSLFPTIRLQDCKTARPQERKTARLTCINILPSPIAPENEFTYHNKHYGPAPGGWGIRLFLQT